MVDRFNIFVGQLYAALRREEGQSMAEYALILALISVVAITALGLIGGHIQTKFNAIESALR